MGVARRNWPAAHYRGSGYSSTCDSRGGATRTQVELLRNSLRTIAMMSISKSGQRGSARLKFILFMAVVILGAYAGYLFLPVAYHAYVWKDLMQHKVDV